MAMVVTAAKATVTTTILSRTGFPRPRCATWARGQSTASRGSSVASAEKAEAEKEKKECFLEGGGNETSATTTTATAKTTTTATATTTALPPATFAAGEEERRAPWRAGCGTSRYLKQCKRKNRHGERQREN